MNKILIIEDDLVVANIYRNKLAVDGFQVDIAHSGEDGLFQITKDKPDVSSDRTRRCFEERREWIVGGKFDGVVVRSVGG